MSRPRLSFISPRFLFPLDEGGKIRTAGILRSMKGGAFEITLLSPAPPRGSYHECEIRSVCDNFRSWSSPHAGQLARLLAFVGPIPISVASDRSAAGVELITEELANRPDVVVFDFPHSAVLMPKPVTVPSVMFTHNIETEIFERHATVVGGFQKYVWRREAAKMRAFERAVLGRFDTVIAVSKRDAAGLTKHFNIHNVKAIDTGVDLEYHAFNPPQEQTDTVVFSGAMDSRSNIDGIRFLMDEVWPLVTAKRPLSRMLIAGRNPPEALVKRAEQKRLNWRFTGFVEDIRPHVLSASVSVIPLRVGSGTRLKALESMALGRPIVSTALGVEGLPLVPDVHFLAAETPEDFSEAILTLLTDRGRREGIARAARDLAEGSLSSSRVGKQFEEICLRTCGRWT